ncbi:MAG: RIP metalloprotease RseP [Muribaculaceae bacterium]|nr:RIP metalloprotease RseP [Muribaculaceae bacterium]
MDTFLIKATQLILAFAILVIIHEFGHFLFARLFGVKVEKFYIFFDPWTELFKWKPKRYIGGLGKKKKIGNYPEEDVEEKNENCKADSSNQENLKESTDSEGDKKNQKKSFWGDTEYGIGWLPLGGYCKISGMIDESMDTEQMKKPPQPWEFRSKPAWQRLLIMIAGVLFNFLLAILIYAGIVYATGEKYVPFNEAKLGMAYSGEARKIGFKDGDIPLYADGEALNNPLEARMKMIQASKVTVLREGKDTVDIRIPEEFIFALDKEAKSDTAKIAFMTYRIPVRITQVAPGDGAAKAGIKTGDEILAIDSIATPSLDIFLSSLAGHEGKTVDIKLVRRTDKALPDTLTIPVDLSENSKMGVGLEVDPAAFFNSKEIKYSLLASIPKGISMGTERLSSYAQSMKLVFTKEGAKSVGGFGSIGSIFPESWDWIAFWNIAAFLSVALAFMNILPIPALDGGHVLFLLYEVVTRRKPSEKFLEYAQMIGMGLLILLLLYANGMDIVRLFK